MLRLVDLLLVEFAGVQERDRHELRPVRLREYDIAAPEEALLITNPKRHRSYKSVSSRLTSNNPGASAAVTHSASAAGAAGGIAQPVRAR